jgi:hypothetical protein
VLGAGKSDLKSVVAGKDCCRACELKIALLDELLENLCASAQASVDLSARVLAIGPLHYEIGGALQQRQKRDQKKEEPSSKTVEAKFQRYPPIDD